MKNRNYFEGPVIDLVRALFGGEDDVLEAARERAKEMGLPLIEVAPEDGAILAALVRLIDARSIVEIGTLFGYSAIWMARELPDSGRLITIEADPAHAQVARENLTRAGLADRVTVLEGKAEQVLPTITGPVDMVFIDADKAGYPSYLTWARRVLRPGGLVAADNAFGWGGIAQPGDDAGASAIRRFLETLASDGAWRSAMIPTLEGLAIGVRV
ncbi:MAG: O-methyltransferase [Acidimicrobiia bacterium]